jgi:hypothetical protein
MNATPTIKKIRLKTCKGGFFFIPARGKRKYIRSRDKKGDC